MVFHARWALHFCYSYSFFDDGFGTDVEHLMPGDVDASQLFQRAGIYYHPQAYNGAASLQAL